MLQELIQEISSVESSNNHQARTSSYSPIIDCLPVDNSAATSGKISFDFLPCHYFDYIAGTASGGIIAVMLGRLRMTVEEAMTEYERLCHEAFDRPESNLKRSLVRYNGAAKIDEPDEIIGDVTPCWPSPDEWEPDHAMDHRTSPTCKKYLLSVQIRTDAGR
ncbi:hypothetical protein ABVK25_006052 [Lepraria finkii]|uniref:PNPLA domain-containing protein n=1 Tax=Lepraria finkii TaxID=1340010 RepID=A0ABR4B8K3_9LECA